MWPRRDSNTQPSDLESDALPLRHGISYLQVQQQIQNLYRNWIKFTFVNLFGLLTIQANNKQAPGSFPSKDEILRLSMLKRIAQSNRPGFTQVTGARPKTNHAGGTAGKYADIPVTCEKSFNDRPERAGTSAPSFDGRRNPTSGTGPPKTL